MNSNFDEVYFYSLVQFTRLNIFKNSTPKSTSISISLEDPLFLCLRFFSMFSYLFLKNGFCFTQSYLSSPSLGRMCSKVKACNQIHFFTPEYMRLCYELDNLCFCHQFKVFTISNIKQRTNLFITYCYSQVIVV